ncbi:MAG: hypothetical protein CMJ25_07890 [Phycisphaerae bacterium]|nr:hypothetical protein [Phycisphaerae bacterium]
MRFVLGHAPPKRFSKALATHALHADAHQNNALESLSVLCRAGTPGKKRRALSLPDKARSKVEPGGIEPVPNPAAFAPIEDSEHSRAILRAVQSDPTLIKLVHVWPALPVEVREAIGLLCIPHMKGNQDAKRDRNT